MTVPTYRNATQAAQIYIRPLARQHEWTTATNSTTYNGNWTSVGTGSMTLSYSENYTGYGCDDCEAGEPHACEYLQWVTDSRTGDTTWIDRRRAYQVYSMTDWAFTTAGTTSSVYRQKSWARWNETAEEKATRERARHLRDLWYLADRGEDMPNPYRGIELTDDEVAEYERRRLARQHAIEARAAATQRAGLLLLSLLDRDQRKEFLSHQRVTEIGPSGAKYVLDNGRKAGNVTVFADAEPTTAAPSCSLCVHVYDDVPNADNLATQLLAIRTDEAMFLGRANVTGRLPAALAEIAAAYRRGELEAAAA